MAEKIILSASIRLMEPGIEIEAQKAWDVLGQINSKYPFLNEFNTDKEENSYRIFSRDSFDREKEAFQISNDRFIMLSIDETNEETWWDKVFEIFKLVNSAFDINPLSIKHLDCQYSYEYKSCINHGKIFFDILGNSENMRGLVGENQIFQFYPKILYYLDIEEQIILLIKALGSSSSSEDRLLKYPEPQSFRVHFGIAKTGNFRLDFSLQNSIEKIKKHAINLRANQIQKYIDNPILEYISKNE